MKLKTLSAGLLLTIAASPVVFAANSATINVSGTVTTGANITGLPQSIDFSTMDPASVSAGTISPITVSNVQIYDNDVVTGTQVTTSCSNTLNNTGCYICNGGDCSTTTSRIELICTYNSCNSGTAYVVTPNASQGNPFSLTQPIVPADSSQAACTTKPGTFSCQLAPTGVYPLSGTFSGVLSLTASDA
ncbi:MAG: hypothetical protein EBX40_04680 [Gammaproteobacteria bacterium]|nr:hypothetical protein [Gammaproteobacteria bacterium]